MATGLQIHDKRVWHCAVYSFTACFDFEPRANCGCFGDMLGYGVPIRVHSGSLCHTHTHTHTHTDTHTHIHCLRVCVCVCVCVCERLFSVGSSILSNQLKVTVTVKEKVCVCEGGW